MQSAKVATLQKCAFPHQEREVPVLHSFSSKRDFLFSLFVIATLQIAGLLLCHGFGSGPSAYFPGFPSILQIWNNGEEALLGSLSSAELVNLNANFV